MLCLSQYKMMLYDTSILYAFESSLAYQVSTADFHPLLDGVVVGGEA